MELAPRYCRTCGSRILVKHICHNCNNEPLKGENYCYNCGSLTPNSDSCLKCGAKYKQNFPVKPVIFGGLLIFVIALAGYLVLSFFDKKDTASDTTVQNTEIKNSPLPKQELNANQPITNNPVDTSHPETTKPVATIQGDTTAKTATPDSIKTITAGIITPGEANSYNAHCTYFEKGMRNKILFFIAGGSGYIKMNDKIYVLKRKRKGVDVSVFAGTEYEVSITIDGLSGSAKEWLASCTLVIKDLVQKTSIKHKVFSSCIEL